MIKRAIYPGSFDPITFGHMDILNRSLNVFDEVIIAVIHNPFKQPLFTQAERINLIKELYGDHPNVIVEGFEGLLVDYAHHKSVNTIIRGLRAVSDFDYEFTMSITNRKLSVDCETVFFMADEKYSFLSSSIIKQIVHFKERAGLDEKLRSFVPDSIVAALKEKIAHA